MTHVMAASHFTDHKKRKEKRRDTYIDGHGVEKQSDVTGVQTNVHPVHQHKSSRDMSRQLASSVGNVTASERTVDAL